MGHSVRAMALLCGALVISTVATGQSREQVNQEARAIFKELIEINTTDSAGNVTVAAEAMAKRLREAGYPEKDVIVAGPEERKKNLVARLRGTGQKKPLLFIGIWTLSRLGAATGRWTPSSSSNATATSMVAAPRI